MKPLSIKNFLPGIAWFFIVLILICLPAEDIPKPSGWFEWMKLVRIDKIVHMGIFAVLTFLFIWPIAKSNLSPQTKWNYFIRISLVGCIWGLTTELIQLFFIPTRNFDLVDWAADSIGVLAAFLFSRSFFSKYLQRKEETQSSI